MKKQTRGWKRIMAVALAVLIAGSTVEPSALTAAAAGQEPTAVTMASDEPDAAVTERAAGNDTVSGNSGTAADNTSGGQYGIATLSGESGSADDVVSLTIGETTTNYTSLSEAVAALPKGSDATLTLLNDCQADLAGVNWMIGSNQSDTITLDLAGHALVTPEDYSLALISNTFIVMSSQAGGELRGGGVYVWPEKTAVFKENVRVTGTAQVNRYNTTICVEGADIAILDVANGSGRISSGSVEEIKWPGGELLAITGGTIGKLNCESYLKRSTAFPDGYGVKDPETGNRYTRAELDAEGFSGKMEVSSCTEHVYEEGYCKYCNALIADCEHAGLDQTTGVCGNCGLQVLAAVRSEEGNVYCTSWETLCSETEKLVDSKDYTVYFYTDVAVTDEKQCARLQNGTVTLDLGGHNIKSGTSGTLFEIAGGTVTIENGTLTGSDKGYVLNVTGGSLSLEKTLRILWEYTLYGRNLSAYGGETTIDGTDMESVMYVAGGTVTILDGSFEGIFHESGTLNLKGGSYHMSKHAAPYDGMSVQVDSGALRDLLYEGYGFRRMEDDGSAGDWILDETTLNGNKFDYAVKVEQLPELSITQQPENKTALAGQQETLSVTATSQKELTYQWYLTDAEGGTDTAVDGATAATLTLPGQSGGTSQTYYCVITCDGYPFRSNTATVTWKNNLASCSYKDGALGYYTGEATVVELSTLKVYNGSTELQEGTDYVIAADSYENNVNLTADGAKAGVTLRGIGSYGGELKVTFDIVNYAISKVATLTDLSDNTLSTGDWAAGVKVKAPAGYLISSTLKGDYTESYTVATEGQTEVSYYLKETTTGYISAEKKIAVKIDKTAPVWAAADGTGEGYGISVKDNWWRELLKTVSFGLLYNDNKLDIKLKASDADSGVMEYWYYIEKIDESDIATGSVTVKTVSELKRLETENAFTKVDKGIGGGATVSGKLDLDGHYVIYAYAKDNVGNASDYICSEGIVIDQTPPDIESEQVPSKAAGTLTEHEGTFTFEASEAGMVSYFVIETTEPEFVAAVTTLHDKMYDNSTHSDDMFAVKNADGRWTLRASAGEPYRYPVSYTGAGGNTKTAEVTIYAQEMQKGKNEIRMSGLQPNTGYKLYLYALDAAGNWRATGGLNSEFTTLKITPIVSATPKLMGFYGEKAKELRILDGTVINPEDPVGSALEGTWSVTDSNAEEYLVLDTTAEYELTFTPEGNTFDSVTVKVMPQVAMKTIYASIKNLERPYGQENPKLTISDLTIDWNQLAPGDTKEELLDGLTLVTNATATSPVGNYEFRIDNASTKYIISFDYRDKMGNFSEYGTLTVKRADAVLTGADSVTQTYGDDPFRLDVTANHIESAIQYELTDGEGVVTVAEDGTVTILKAGTATIKVSLPESKNYKAAEKTITVNVGKKRLSSTATSKTFYYDRDHEAELDIRAFLPEDCGRVEIAGVYDAHEKVVIDKTAYDDETGILPYQVLKNDMDASATVEISVASENYWTIDISLTVTWSSKLDVYVKQGQKVTLKNSVMTYGDSLSTLEFEPVEFVDAEGNVLKGTLAWEDETEVPNYYSKTATWKFTPDDESYAVLTDFVSITVNRAKPNVDSKPRPSTSNIVYNPAQTLADFSLWGANLSWTIGGKNTKLYGGTWSWVNPTEVPAAGTNSYEVHYEPSDGNYMSFTVMIDVTVAKAKPYIEIAPTAAEITYGDSLGVSGLTGGKAVYGDGKGNASSLTGGDAEVTGTFGWSTPDGKPTVSDSNTTEYEVVFTPTDTDNYETVTTKIKLTVNKAENAPDMPGDTMNVAYKCRKVSDVALDRENWAWQDSDLETALSVGVETTVTAVYTGADKGNYENETVVVKITRSACEHPQTVVRDAKEENCTEKGYTGDTYCTECNEMTASGTEIPAKGHKGGTASCTKKAVCEVCQKEYGEVDATNHPATEIRNVKEASCTEAGYTGDTCCTACNEILTSGTEIPAKGHKGGTASCTKKAVCEVCQKEYGEVDATNHPATEIRNEKEASCTEAGYTGDTCCTACSKVLTSGTVIPAKGHSYTSVITKQPTTAEEGIRTYTCGNCGHSYTEPVAKLSDGDSGSEDTGNTDTGNTDTGNTASGSADTGNTDTGSEDTGNTDTGNTDTGNTDTGNTDTGSTGTGSQNTGSTDTHNADAEDGSRDAKPFLKGENGKEGWDVICEEAKQAPAGEEIPVDMNGTTEVPGSLFDLIRGEDVTLVFDMGNGITWSVNGQDVTAGGVRDIDFGVKYGAQAEGNIPVSVINKVTGEKFYTGLSLSYDGEFGFQAVLSLNMDQKNAGLYASLYYYNEQTGQMEFICEEQIGEDGSVALTFTHASEYILMVDAKTVEQESADTETGNLQPADTGMVATSTQEETHTAWWIFLIGAAAAGAIAVILVTRKRR